jgi:putative oxidoreductase
LRSAANFHIDASNKIEIKTADHRNRAGVITQQVRYKRGGLVDWIFNTTDSLSYVFLRFGLALTFFFHGTQHMFGWHGGKGFKDQVANWSNKYHIPVAVGMLGVATELFTVVAMTLGFLVRPAAFFLAIFIGTAMFKSHWGHGFFLQQKHGQGSGIEYTLALLLMALAVLFGGAGAFSIDRLIRP